jgi:hypothetical protein
MRVNTTSGLWKCSVQRLQCVRPTSKESAKGQISAGEGKLFEHGVHTRTANGLLGTICEFIRESKYTCVLLHLNGVVKPKIVATGMVASKLQPDVAPP